MNNSMRPSRKYDERKDRVKDMEKYEMPTIEEIIDRV